MPSSKKLDTNGKKMENSKEQAFKNFSIDKPIFQFVVLCCCAATQNVINASNTAILTTIERAFLMKTVETALFLVLHDISNILASPIIGYFGDRKHQSKIVSLSMIGLGITSIILTLPQLISFGQQKTQIEIVDTVYHALDVNGSEREYINESICSFNRQPGSLMNFSKEIINENCKKSPYSLNNMKYIFYLANIVHGVSSVALYTIAISYIEKLFTKEKAPIYQGIYVSIAMLGVAIGILGSGAFLNLNSSLSKNSGSSTNVNFVGAWWFVYVFSALASFTLAVLVSRFKSKPQNTNTSDDNNPDNVPPTRLPDTKAKFKYHIKEFRFKLVAVFTNKIYMSIIVCATIETFIKQGYSNYLIKNVEYQFRTPASLATMTAGGVGFLSLFFGVGFGSFLTRRFKWSIRECAIFAMIVKFFSSFLFLGLMIHCPQEEFIGKSTIAISNGMYNTSLNCNCNPNAFNPVCYKTKYLFQTPCHAACMVKDATDRFSHCYLLNDLENMTAGIGNITSRLENDTFLTLKSCSRPASQCTVNFVLVIIVSCLITFSSSTMIIPLLKCILDCIGAESMSFALGLRSLITKVFGQIPGPLILAAVIDKSCLLWIKGDCVESRTCRLYNNKEFAFGFGIIGFCFRICSALFALLTIYLIRKKTISEKLEKKKNANIYVDMGYDNKIYL